MRDIRRTALLDYLFIYLYFIVFIRLLANSPHVLSKKLMNQTTNQTRCLVQVQSNWITFWNAIRKSQYHVAL